MVACSFGRMRNILLKEFFVLVTSISDKVFWMNFHLDPVHRVLLKKRTCMTRSTVWLELDVDEAKEVVRVRKTMSSIERLVK